MRKGINTHIQVAVLNNSHHDAVLQPKVTLGSLHQIQSISPLKPLELTDKEKKQLIPQSKAANTTQNQQEVISVDKTGKSTNDHIQKILREFDLQGLNENEREQTFKLLREEADVFCLDSDDIGHVTECKMKIQLKDQAPVQKTYYSIPKPLHLEVKHYIEDLLIRVGSQSQHHTILHHLLRFERKMEVFDCAMITGL